MRDLDDEQMLKVAAGDNDEVYNPSPTFILEMVQAAKAFIERKGSRRTSTPTSPTKGPDLDVQIAKFLIWPKERVSRALAQLTAIEHRELSRDAVAALPTMKMATALERQVKKAKKRGKPLSHEQQVQVSRRAREASDVSVEVAVEQEVACTFASAASEPANRAQPPHELAEPRIAQRRECLIGKPQASLGTPEPCETATPRYLMHMRPRNPETLPDFPVAHRWLPKQRQFDVSPTAQVRHYEPHVEP